MIGSTGKVRFCDVKPKKQALEFNGFDGFSYHYNIFNNQSYQAIYNFSNKKLENISCMQEFSPISTPLKEHQFNSKLTQTAQYTPEGHPQEVDVKVDYKAKAFKMMKQLAETEVVNKKSLTQIRHLQRDIQSYRQDFHRVFTSLGVGNYEQALKKILYLTSCEQASNRAKVEQWSNLVEQYKKIINAQQYKFIRQEQQLKISEMKYISQLQRLRRFEQQQQIKEPIQVASETMKASEQELNKSKVEVQQKAKQIAQLTSQLSILKNEYKKLLIDRQKCKDQLQQLQEKYNMEIQHFQQMQKHVEERLMQVERQMNFYRDEREAHLQKIDLLKKQIQYSQNKQYFSFGGVKHTQTQTDFDEEGSSYNYQCLQISIKTLLQQNSKLKNTLLVLYQKKPEEELPRQIELELKILLNMHDSNLKQRKTDNYEIETHFESEQKGKQESQWVENKIEEAGEDEQDQKSSEADVHKETSEIMSEGGEETVKSSTFGENSQEKTIEATTEMAEESGDNIQQLQ